MPKETSLKSQLARPTIKGLMMNHAACRVMPHQQHRDCGGCQEDRACSHRMGLSQTLLGAKLVKDLKHPEGNTVPLTKCQD